MIEDRGKNQLPIRYMSRLYKHLASAKQCLVKKLDKS